MVSELLDQADNMSSRADIQVTGKVAVTTSSSPTSTTANTTSVIRCSPQRGQSASPDSPDSNGSSHEDSAWFLRQVLQRNPDQDQQREAQRSEASGQVETASPLTPATSPAGGRGVRRPRSSQSVDEEVVDDEDDASSEIVQLQFKSESVTSEPTDMESKRSRVENIVSSIMRPTTGSTSAFSGGLQQRSSEMAVNTAGCKKRKLYQPQQHESSKFTSEGEEEDEDNERHDDSLVSEEQDSTRDMLSGRPDQQNYSNQRDPLRSLQERIASLHHQQQRYTAHHLQSPVSHEKQITQSEARRPVRDDAGRSRHSLHLNASGTTSRNATLPTDLNHLTQAHVAYIDATRRLLVEQQQHQQQQIHLTRQRQQSVKVQEQASAELEGLADMLKSELAAQLAQLIDNTLTRFAHQQQQQQRRTSSVLTGPATPSKISDSAGFDIDACSKLQRGRVIDRGMRNGDLAALGLTPFLRTPYAAALPHLLAAQSAANPLTQIALANMGAYTQPQAQPQIQSQSGDQPQPSPSRYNSACAAATASASEEVAEQNEALSLVVSPKKRRVVKTTDRESPVPSGDTRLSPLEISLSGHALGAHSPPLSRSPTPTPPTTSGQRFTPQPTPSQQPPAPHPASHQQLLHHPSLFSNYSAYFAAAAAGAAAAAPASSRTKSPDCVEHSPPSAASLLHPALLASHASSSHLHHHHRHHHHSHSDSLNDRHSDSSDGPSPYDGIHQSSTLTPMHLRKAKLMFFWVRYPSSSVLKTFFPDVKFNKNNTAQLVKWFSNFR